MGLIKSLFHVCIFCNDIKASLDFYQKIGCKIAFDQVDQSKGDVNPWNYYLELCEGQFLELQPCKANNPHPHPDECFYYVNQTIWHFSLETENMAELLETLKKGKITVWQFPDPGAKEVKEIGDVILGSDGCFTCWIFDPDGTPIELMEQTKYSKQHLTNE